MSFLKKTFRKAIASSKAILTKADDFLAEDSNFLSSAKTPHAFDPNEKKPQTELSEEEARRKALLDDIPVGLYRTTRDGRILEANMPMVEMLGYPDREAFLNTMAGDCYLDKSERERCNGILAHKGVVRDFETRFQCWDGRIIWVRDSCAEVRDDKGNLLYYQGSVQEITETKLAQQALVDSEERYRNLIERQGDGLAVVDENETFTFTNPIAEEIFGLQPGGLIGRNLREFMDKETFEAIKEQTAKRRRGARSTYDVEIIRADGERRSLVCTATPWKDKVGDYSGAFAIFHDNTLHREAIKALKTNEEKYRAVMNQSAECIFLLEPINKIILEANSAFRRLLGYRKEAIVNLSVQDFVDHPIQDIEDNISRVRDSKSYFLGERRYRHKDGRIVFVEVNASLISYGGKDVLCIVSRDITERKQAAEALKESEERLRQSQRLDAVGRLAGGVAHDFNNLMAGIIGCAELLLKRTNEKNPLRKHIQEIYNSAERAAALTQQLLSFSRRRSIKARKVDLNKTISDMKDLLLRMLGKKSSLCLELSDAPCTLKADRGQMEQILLNLVHNAGDAMPEGGKVFVTTKTVQINDDEAAKFAYSRPGEFIRLTVQDEGHGMSQEIKDRVFDPFFTTKEQGKGTGLGLSTVYGIVKNHHGWIMVDSEPGKGSTFQIFLPSYNVTQNITGDDKLSGSKLNRENKSNSSMKNMVVLLVDNDEKGRKQAVKMLNTHGYIVETASCAAEAFKLSEHIDNEKPSRKDKKTNRWDLVITNLTLPDESGVRLADEIRTRHPQIPVLLCGTFSKDVARLTAVGEKGYGYLQRPYYEEDLLDAVRESVNKTKRTPRDPV